MRPKKKGAKGPAGYAFRSTVPPRPCWLCRESPQVVEFYCRPCWEHQRRAEATIKRVNRGRKVQRLAPVEERGQGL